MLILDCLQFCADILIVLPQNEQNGHLKWLQNESSDNVQLLDTVYYKQKNQKKTLYMICYWRIGSYFMREYH